jgi:hypothetical protein
MSTPRDIQRLGFTRLRFRCKKSGRDFSNPFPCLPPSPALAPDSSSSSGQSDTSIAGNPEKVLDYEQELVQVQEEEKD